MDKARLATSELVTNSIKYARPPLVLSLDWSVTARDAADVAITVTDGGSGRHRRHQECAASPAATAEAGRGLALVQALARAWFLDAGPDGSQAWCLVHGPAEDRPSARDGEGARDVSW